MRTLLILLSLVVVEGVFFSVTFAESTVSQAQLTADKDKKELKEKILTLKSLFSKELKNSKALTTALPKEWIDQPEQVEDEIQKLENKLLKIKSEKNTDARLDQEELFILQLQWLKLPLADKKRMLSELRAKEISIETNQKGELLVQEATLEAEDSNKIEQQIERQVKRTKSEREESLLKKRLDLEKKQQELLSKKKDLGKIQKQFSDQVEKWGVFESSVNKALDSSGVVFLTFRQPLRDKLKESNRRVISQGDFFEFYLKDLSQFKYTSNQETPVVREGDLETVKSLVQDIHRKSIDLGASADLLSSELEDLKIKLIEWEKSYRERLLELRGKIISRLKLTNFDQTSDDLTDQKFELLFQEMRTISSTLLFWIWSFKDTYLKQKNKNYSLLKKIEEYSHLVRVLLLVFVAVWILLKRKRIIDRIQLWIARNFTRRRRWLEIFSELIRDLYTFFVLLFLGTLAIDFGAGIGFSFLLPFRSFLESFLIFFLLWGLIDFISPVLSQRKLRADKNAVEVRAMEELFEFFPKVLLVFFLVKAVLTRFLFVFLSENFIVDNLLVVLEWAFLFILYFGIWYKRDSWRLVAKKATNSDYWVKLLAKVHGKVWEPLILIFGGGLGVYLLAWRIIRKRIGDLEFAKSFQAMVSRALLERKRKQALSRVVHERFPGGYLRSFNHETRALPEWHIERKEPLTRLQEAYRSWQSGKEGTTVLLTGDRGVGKSELAYQFFRLENISAKESKLKPGDTTIEDVCKTLSDQLFEGGISGGFEEFCRKVQELEPSVILMENLENCILRQIDGFQTFTQLVDLVMRTSGRHLWIVSFTTYAWTIAKQGVPGADCFSHYIYLSGMTEDEIQNLVLTRHRSSANLPIDFSDLSLADEKSVHTRGLSQTEKEERSKNLYFRILWDYTGGNPRQALYFWKTSLSFESSTAKVRLFDVPEQDVLENFRDKTLMLLSALVEHNGLTLLGLSEVLNESKESVRRWIEEVMPYGILYSFGNSEKGTIGWHVESFWMSAIESYLEKRRLLFRGGLR